MKKILSILIVLAGVFVMLDAQAVELRRPYEAAHAVSYGYDNAPGTSGCSDHECGSICYNGHTGSDFPLSLGTNVLAGADGTVTAVNNSCANYGSLGNTCGGRCGNYVQIRHADGDLTIYCHMRRDHMAVSTGQSVSCGQLLGQSASSGSSTGPHLHLGWRPGGGSSTDTYAGSCNSSPGAWRQQNSYGQAPGASCGCVPSTEVCDGTDNNCDGTVDSGDVCEIDLLHEAPHSYTQPVSTDVTGDGLQNVCARFAAGFRCFGPTGDGWSEVISTTMMAEENGWGFPQYYSTIRMGDIDGDGRADVCARHSGGFTCWLSTGDGFEEFDTVNWNDDGSWNRPEYYTTIRLADLNGNGRHDVCARGAAGWRCHLSLEDGFGPRIDGPEWSNSNGFNRARYYGTIRVADIDGDGKDDVCMRTPDGYECHRSTGEGFEPLVTEPTMTDSNGWGNIIFWPSIRLADIDGNGQAALCARNSTQLFCQRFDGEEFGPRLRLAGLSNDSGWADPTNYATLRVGDVTGDGSDDLCIRANARMLCFRIDGDDVTRWDGPEWSNANGWDEEASHGPLFITNIDDGERGALCGRSDEGLTCEQYTDGDFEAYPRFNQFTDGGGWTARKYYSTIRMGQGDCRADWCVEEEEPDDEPGDPDSDGDSDSDYDSDSDADGYDVGISPDAGDSSGENMNRASTSSCAAIPSEEPGGGLWFIVLGLGLLWRRKALLRWTPVLLIALVSVGLVGCDRTSEEESAEAAVAEDEAVVESTVVEPAAAGEFEEYDVLAISGSWRVVGEPLEVPERADGPLRYRPVLLDGEESVRWPLSVEVISEARLVGEGPDLLALGLDGKLSRIDLGSNAHGIEEYVAEDVTSQVTVSVDGCCVTYIREHSEGQTLEIYHLEDARVDSIQLGYSLGWAPVVSAGGETAAWTASPMGHASILVAGVNDDEPRAIVNADEHKSADDLDPFPVGIHAPVWTAEGIAFEGANSRLWLIDEEGAYLGSADGSKGMFWDEARQELVDRDGYVVQWQD